MDYFTETKTIYGRVEKVIDGDTLRVTHCPTYFTCPDLPSPKVKPLSEATLSIRLYGVDCPELQKKKSDPPSQPYAKQAKEYTSTVTLDKTIQLKLLKKDQYGRAVSKISNYGTPINDLSLDLLSRGYAVMYTGKGAVYDGDDNKALFQQIQQTAKTTKVGMWSLGDEMMTPAEYKRMYKNQQNGQQQNQNQQQVPTALATTATSSSPIVPMPAVPATSVVPGEIVAPATP